MTAAKLMTNLLPSYYDFIEKEARQKKKSKRQIIETAIALYMRESEKQRLLSAYKSMGEDKEYQKEMKEDAELGMGYYLNDLEA